MSDEPKPSEHAMRAANQWAPNTHQEYRISLAKDIDQYAIAPAVAERDRRIEELGAALDRIQGLTMSQFVKASDAFQCCREIAAVALAKSERSAP